MVADIGAGEEEEEASVESICSTEPDAVGLQLCRGQGGPLHSCRGGGPWRGLTLLLQLVVRGVGFPNDVPDRPQAAKQALQEAP